MSFCMEKYYTEEIADNINTNPKILWDILKEGNDDFISEKAALNPNCTSKILENILKRKRKSYVSYAAAKNPNCSSKMLFDILKKITGVDLKNEKFNYKREYTL